LSEEGQPHPSGAEPIQEPTELLEAVKMGGRYAIFDRSNIDAETQFLGMVNRERHAKLMVAAPRMAYLLQRLASSDDIDALRIEVKRVLRSIGPVAEEA
jgi:hypothetical protein